MVTSQEEMRAALKDACAPGGRSRLHVGADDLAAAPALKVVQKFGTGLRNIDTAACAAKGVKLLTIRRRANISCAEHAFALMLMLARKLETVSGLVTPARVKAAGTRAAPVRPPPHAGRQLSARRRHACAQRCDHRHHWPRRDRARDCAARHSVRHARALSPAHARAGSRGARIEGDPRAACHAACRKRLDRAAGADRAGTRDLLGRAELAQIKPGACIVNVPTRRSSTAMRCWRRCAPGGSAASRSTCTTRSRSRTTMRCSASTT